MHSKVQTNVVLHMTDREYVILLALVKTASADSSLRLLENNPRTITIDDLDSFRVDLTRHHVVIV